MSLHAPSPRVRWGLFAILAVELVALTAFDLPGELDFSSIPFCDAGANLSLQYLISHGYRPTIDFAYLYGLLPVLLGRLWFTIAGLTPFANQALLLLCGLGMAFAFARIAAALRIHQIAVAVLIVTLWFSIHPDYPALAQALEALLLALALSEQAVQHRQFALALITAAVFTKPSMAYVYGALLVVIWFARTPTESRRSRFLPEVGIPVGITAAGCVIVLSAFYGPMALIRTVLPLEGASTYRIQHFGFFTGSGRAFWNPPHDFLMLYVFGPAGIWITATIFLACATIGVAYRFWARSKEQDSATPIRDEIIFTCFVLHVAFVCLFFGNQWSWFYYSYFLIIGVVAAVDTGPVARRAGIAICIIGAVSGFGVSHAVYHLWKTDEVTAVTAGMYSQPPEATEWSHVLDMTRGHRTTILDTKGAAELMFPGFQPPVSLYLDPGLMLQSEIDRKVRQLQDSDMVVVPLGPVTCGGIPRAPEIYDAMCSFDLIFRGSYFDVYRHRKIAAVSLSS
ncbi:MAG: hypothetical protein WA740_15855 [Candidatus Binataceae bacterium]